jgi:hypothetical protein
MKAVSANAVIARMEHLLAASEAAVEAPATGAR